MNRYRVEARETIYTSYLVEASSKEEAQEMVEYDDMEPTTSYCEDGDFHVFNVKEFTS